MDLRFDFCPWCCREIAFTVGQDRLGELKLTGSDQVVVVYCGWCKFYHEWDDVEHVRTTDEDLDGPLAERPYIVPAFGNGGLGNVWSGRPGPCV